MTPEEIAEFQAKLNTLENAAKREDALAYILEKEKQYPNSFEVWNSKTAFLGRLDRYEEMIIAADKAIDLKPDSYGVHHMKGMALYRLKRYHDAILAFDSALAITPNFYHSISFKISALIFSGQYKQAVELYEESDLPSQGAAIGINNIGWAYAELGDYDRAIFYLKVSRSFDFFNSFIHYNLARILWRKGDYLKFAGTGLGFLFFSALERMGLKPYLEKLNPPDELSDGRPIFRESGRLFKSSPGSRETRAILRILSGMNATALCNDTWSWFAVNIPYHAVEKNGFRGDIDIILKRPRYFLEHDAGFTYRGFQVKVVLVDKYGHIKSAKRGPKNHYGIKKQLNILNQFGCEQVFLLEVFVLERGYSQRNIFPSSEIKNELIEKGKYLRSLGFGYVVMAEEPSLTTDDEAGGMVHMPINILRASTNPISENFQKLADRIDAFLSNSSTESTLNGNSQRRQLGPVVGYCGRCKSITAIASVGFMSGACSKCNKILD